MKEIKLNKGYIALVDDKDYHRVAGLNWRVSLKKNKTPYAVAVIKLHRVILDVRDSGIKVDHINRNGLDCRRVNLRTASYGENIINSAGSPRRVSKYKGVRFHKASRRWVSGITRAGISFITYHDSELEAAIAYDVRARANNRDFSYTNFDLCPMTFHGASFRYVWPT